MKCVLYLRISTKDKGQDTENQKTPLQEFAKSLGFEVLKVYCDTASGGNSNRPQFQAMLKDAKQKKFDVILVWSLDRFSREGISNTLSYLENLKRSGVALKSLQEGWLDTSDQGMGQLLIAIMAWVAKQERERISTRVKAGLRRTRSNGTILGRPSGSKDKGRRVKSGYYIRWAKKRAKATAL